MLFIFWKIHADFMFKFLRNILFMFCLKASTLFSIRLYSILSAQDLALDMEYEELRYYVYEEQVFGRRHKF